MIKPYTIKTTLVAFLYSGPCHITAQVNPPPPPCWPPPLGCPLAPILPVFAYQTVAAPMFWPNQIQAVDMNQDGCMDVLVTPTYYAEAKLILQNSPCSSSVSFLNPPTIIAPNGVWMAHEDFTGDGTVDIVLTKTSTMGSPFFPNIYLQTGSLGSGVTPPVTFSETVVSPVFSCPGAEDLSLIVVGNLNSADTFPDAVVACDGSILVFLNDALNSFSALGSPTTIMTFGIGSSAQNLELLDINDDGDLDIVAAEASTTYYALNNGDGTFAPQVTVGLPGQNDYACAADFDGDGKLDFVTYQGSTVKISLNDGNPSPTFSTAVVICPIAGTVYNVQIMIECGDINGDSLPDIVVGANAAGVSNVVTAYLSCGGGLGNFPTFHEHEILQTGGELSVLHLADMNSDGYLDVLIGMVTPSGGEVSLLLNSAVAPTSDPTLSTVPSISTMPSLKPSALPTSVPSTFPTIQLPVLFIPCVTPPDNMVGWWTFDEPTGSTIASDITAGGHDASIVNSPLTASPGYVGPSAHFNGVNQHAVVPHHSDFNFPDLQFTIDFWIRPDAGELFGTIVRKGIPSPNVPSLYGPGYHLWYNQGHFFMTFSDGSAPWFLDISDNFLFHADPEVWTFVAVVVNFGPLGYIKLYIDGVMAQINIVNSGPGGTIPDTSNTEPLVIAGLDAPLPGCPPDASFFAGRIDELEIFDRPLGLAEIQSIYNAGSGGKCKDSIHVPWDKDICVNKHWVNSQLEICNNGVLPAQYSINFGPISANGANCLVSGPIGFEDPLNPFIYYPCPPGNNLCATGPKTIGPINPGTCHVETFRIYKPLSLNVLSQVSCFTATVINLATNQELTTMGSIQGTPPCLVIVKHTYNQVQKTYSNNTESQVLIPGVSRKIYLDFYWDQETKYGDYLDKRYGGKFGGEEVVDIIAKPYNADMSGRSAPLSINGMRPGEEYHFKVAVAHHNNSSNIARIELDVLIASSLSFQYFDIIFYKVFTTQNDKEGRNYTSEFPISSLGFRTTQGPDSDSDGDGISDAEEVESGLDPYLKDIELDRVFDFYEREVRLVKQRLSIFENRVYQPFMNPPTCLPAAMDNLDAVLEFISRNNFYAAINHADIVISVLKEMGPAKYQCKATKNIEQHLKGQNMAHAKSNNEEKENKKNKTIKSKMEKCGVKNKEKDNDTAPEVIPLIRILDIATKRLMRYLAIFAEQ